MYTKEELEEATKNSFSYSQVLRVLKRNITGTSHRLIKKNIIKYQIDTSHFKLFRVQDLTTQQKVAKNRLIYNKNLSHRISNKQLKKSLFLLGRIYECVRCKNNGIWLDKNLRLEIHHIDGDWRNNSPENLEFLCPNCHSQTENYFHQSKKYYCQCGKEKHRKSKLCFMCNAKLPKTYKVKLLISEKELEKLVWSKPITKIAKDYNVSDTAIRKLIKKFKINQPKQGYWLKQK